jgi:subtilisin family serine protease
LKIAIIDSGVHATHPHVGGCVSGFALQPDGPRGDDYVDRIGHGTAVAAAIREKVPDAELIAIKVFHDSLRTDAGTLARAIRAAIETGADLVNLSLGTTQIEHAALFRNPLERAQARGVLVIAARDDGRQKWLPGILDGVIGVRVDWECPRDECRVVEIVTTGCGESLQTRNHVLAASGYPRDIPGVPRERNLKGVSFAVANATGLIARELQAGGPADIESIFERLARPPAKISAEA